MQLFNSINNKSTLPLYCVNRALNCKEFSLKQAADKFANSSAVYFGACNRCAHCTIFAKWHSAANSKPCDSAQACRFRSLLNNFAPNILVHNTVLFTIVDSALEEIQWKS